MYIYIYMYIYICIYILYYILLLLYMTTYTSEVGASNQLPENQLLLRDRIFCNAQHLGTHRIPVNT